MIKIKDENQLMDIAFRAAVIKDINGPESTLRRNKLSKAYEIFKDKTVKYVIEKLKQESVDANGVPDMNVIKEMEHRAANISIFRKIVDKKAMVYKDAAIREGVSEIETSQINAIVKELNINNRMKKANKYVEAFKNCDIKITPYKDEIGGKYKIQAKVLVPGSYEVVVDSENPEIARVYVFPYLIQGGSAEMEYVLPTTDHGKRPSDGQISVHKASRKQENKYEYVWWSNYFHFTTNEKGEFIADKSPDKYKNPIELLPIVSLSADRDGAFWAEGGEDLVDDSVLVNLLLTDLYYILKFQGSPIFYMTGKGLPKNLKIGPQQAVFLETKEGSPVPSIGFAAANPNVEAHMSLVEKLIALILTTNNLEPGTVTGTISAVDATSGIQEMIRRSENIDDIEDQRELYRDAEPQLFKIYSKWHNLYFDGKLLCDELMQIKKLSDALNPVLKFLPAQPYMSEKEKLEVIDKRMSLDLDSQIDALMRDNADMTREDAILKIKQLVEDQALIESLGLVKKVIEEKENGGQGNLQDGSDDSRPSSRGAGSSKEQSGRVSDSADQGIY